MWLAWRHTQFRIKKLQQLLECLLKSFFSVFPSGTVTLKSRETIRIHPHLRGVQAISIAKTRTTPTHPQSDGLVERFNRTLLSMLATAATDHPFDWERQIRPLCMAYNTSVHPATGYSPFFLMFGRSVQMPIDLMYGQQPTPVDSDTDPTSEYARNLKMNLQEAYTRVRDQMGHRLDRQKELYNQKVHDKPFAEDDLVWLHTTVLRKGCARKLHRPWSGPFRVLKRTSDSVYRLQNVCSRRHRPVVHFNRLKRCPVNIRLPQPIPHRSRSPRPETPSSPGTNLTPVPDIDNTLPSPVAPRYPQRDRQPPDRFLPVVTH